MEELRGRQVLKTVQFDPEQMPRLRQLARASGKPFRWHIECVAQEILGLAAEGYEVRNLQSIARDVLASWAEERFNQAEAVRRIRSACDAVGVPRAHPQIARKHLREAARSHPEALDVFSPRRSRPFTADEDLQLDQLRVEGASLSAIGAKLGRRPNVVLRRLVYLAEAVERGL